jgi:hypothetical protein
MIRRIVLLLLGIALTVPLVAALAGEPGEPPVRLKKKDRKDPAPGVEQKKDKEDQKKTDDLDLDKELRKGEGKDSIPDPARKKAEEEMKELIARLHKNMDASEDRLAKRDPGDATRDIQKDILKDLDELIKQQQDQQDQDSQCKNGECDKDNPSSSNTKNRKNASKKQGQSLAKNKPQGDPKKSPSDKTGKQTNSDANVSSDTVKLGSGKTNNKEIEMHKGIWGHLPETQRQEMDAYARERFMPRYEELLRQYYRTLSEQTRKRKGD